MENRREMELMTKGRSCFERGDYKLALTIFNEIIETNNNNSEAFFYLANIFHLKGEIGKAIKAFNKVLELDPCHTDASISLSVLYNDIGRYEEAKKIFETANQKVKRQSSQHGVADPHLNKKFAFKHFELAEMYLSYNRYDEALFEYNKSIGLTPDNLDARVKIAKVYAKKGFISKAFEELRKLKNEQPTYLPAGVALGILYYGNGNVLEAEMEWQRVLARDPSNSEAGMYLNLAKTATETSLT